MTFDTEGIISAARQIKGKLSALADTIDNYTVFKKAGAVVKIKSKKPAKTLYQCDYDFEKEMPLLKVLCLAAGAIFAVCLVMKIAKLFYKLECRREWNRNQKQKEWGKGLFED